VAATLSQNHIEHLGRDPLGLLAVGIGVRQGIGQGKSIGQSSLLAPDVRYPQVIAHLAA
jgi:hypothetical protein